jgi:hypothetical protein
VAAPVTGVCTTNSTCPTADAGANND